MLIIKSAPDSTPLKAVRFGSPAPSFSEFLFRAALTKDDSYLYAIGRQAGAYRSAERGTYMLPGGFRSINLPPSFLLTPK